MQRITKIILAGTALIITGAAVSLGLLFISPYQIEGKTYVYIDNDDNTDSIRKKITDAAHPGQLVGFRLLQFFRPMSVHSGRYEIRSGESQLTTYRKIAGGIQSPVNLTIPSVRTLDKFAGFLGRKLMLDSATVSSALHDSAFCAMWGHDTATIISLFIPNTYQVYWNISLHDFMTRMQKESENFWQSNQRSEAAQALNLSHNEVMTLASIVDEETANNAEKPMIAGMYMNRLRRGMPLQADPTIKFALQDFSLRRIYHKHLEVASPYNTYKNLGLPPGPIRIPGIAAIDAVLHMIQHDYLYMCAKEDFSGTHNFASTYQEHLANARKYTKALNERNIK